MDDEQFPIFNLGIPLFTQTTLSGNFQFPLLNIPLIGQTPQQPSWALQLFQQRRDLQNTLFNNAISAATDLSKFTLNLKKQFALNNTILKNKTPDFSLNFLDSTQQLQHSMNLNTGLALSQSSDSDTLLLGNLLTNDAIQETKDLISEVLGNNGKKSFNINPLAASIAVKSLDTVNNLLGARKEYSGKYGTLASGLDKGYDTISNGVFQAGLQSGNPYAMAAGVALKLNGTLSKGVGKLGGGTDGMTKQDAVLGSAFMQLSPVGLVNGFFGKKTDTITADDETRANVGTSYSGTFDKVDDALTVSNKKYGLFSSHARNKANQAILEAKRQQYLAGGISKNAQDLFNIQGSMSAINDNRRLYQLNGGWGDGQILFGRQGTKLPEDDIVFKEELIDDIEFEEEIIEKFLKGSLIKQPYKEWVKDVNPEYVHDDLYDLEAAYNYYPLEKLNKWKFAVNSDDPDYYLSIVDENGEYPYHLGSIMELDNGDYKFLKKGKESDNKEVHFETDTYHNGSNGLKDTHDLVYEGDRYYYRKKKNAEKFEEGGKFNVIPEGALHARKHNIDIDGITKKGIPVVSEDENGNVELQAEVEVNEIILRLELTKKLEELSRMDSDKSAIEAGKLLVDEILNNTVDNTNLILETK